MNVKNEWSVWIERYSEYREKIRLCNYSGDYEDAIAKGKELAGDQLGAIVVVRLGSEHGAIYKEPEQRKMRESAIRARQIKASTRHNLSGISIGITKRQLNALVVSYEEEREEGSVKCRTLRDLSGGHDDHFMRLLVAKRLLIEVDRSVPRVGGRRYCVTEGGLRTLEEARRHGWI